MNRLGKTLGWVCAVLAVVLAAGITLMIGWRPFIGPRTYALTEGIRKHADTSGALLASSCTSR
jgi:hypothetical protein